MKRGFTCLQILKFRAMGIIIHRTPQQIQSEINLTKANIKQVENGLHYSPKDQEILIPHYKKLLQKLSLELSKIHNDIN